MPEYKITQGGMHQQFLQSVSKLQVIGGGFGNGKTAAVCVKAVQLIQGYPGSNGLIARATFPKLNDTIRKEFKKWCPPSLIASFPESKNSDNTAKFNNGSAVNFRYIAQQGKSAEQTTSNLLSATYDWAIVDQMEDPEITEKDFYDLLGRLRGNTVYRGMDPRMPKTGPRWLMMTVNPTANWFYKRIIRPLKIYEATGRITDDLLCERDDHGRPIMVNDKPIMLLQLFEGSTYENARNLGPDFIKTLESTYKGQMRDRFLSGKWASYEGLVYHDFNDAIHMVPHNDMMQYMDHLTGRGYKINFVEAYDFGISSPSCFLLAFVGPMGDVHIIDGFHKGEYKIGDQIKNMLSLRAEYGAPDDALIYGDPSIFRRQSVQKGTVGKSTSAMFHDESKGRIRFRRGNNDIANGILKVTGYLTVHKNVLNPYTGDSGAPMLYISDKLEFMSNEFGAYMWKKRSDGGTEDVPNDKDDHAMDALKYLLTDAPEPGQMLIDRTKVPEYMKWQEREVAEEVRYSRYG